MIRPSLTPSKGATCAFQATLAGDFTVAASRLSAAVDSEQNMNIMRNVDEEAIMVRALVEDLIELVCLAAFLSGVAALAHHGAASWLT